jgi:hypothetical protein
MTGRNNGESSFRYLTLNVVFFDFMTSSFRYGHTIRPILDKNLTITESGVHNFLIYSDTIKITDRPMT